MADPKCLCGNEKFDHQSGKGRCKRCRTCDRYEPDIADELAITKQAVEASDNELATQTSRLAAARRELEEAKKAADTERADLNRQIAEARNDRDHAQRLVQDAWEALASPDASNLSAGILALRRERDVAATDAQTWTDAAERLRAENARFGEELAGALQRLAEYDSGASVDRLLHDADAIGLDRADRAAAAVRTAASALVEVLATAPRELELRAEAQRLANEAARVDEELRRLVAGENNQPSGKDNQ